MASKPALVVVATAYALGLGMILPPDAVCQEAPWAEAQQAQLALDIRGGDDERRQRAVFVAEGLGASRVSNEVRMALIALLEQYNDDLDAARARGIPGERVVPGEFFLRVADIVAELGDPRAIPALARVGNNGFSRAVAQALALFGEQALPAILEVIEIPEEEGGEEFALMTNLHAIAMMVADGGASELSASSRGHLVRVAREYLSSLRANAVVDAIDISVALNEPELVETVESMARDPSVVAVRGVGEQVAGRIHQHAVSALGGTQLEAR